MILLLKKDIILIEIGHIEKQIVEILISDGYKLSRSNARYIIRKVIKDNTLKINKYFFITSQINMLDEML